MCPKHLSAKILTLPKVYPLHYIPIIKGIAVIEYV